jgi:hypothetical protein
VIALALLLALGDPAETLALRESAKVEGRFVKLADLVDAAGLREDVRASLAGVWLGRSPAAGRSRVVTAADVRRELAWRGLPWSVRDGEVRVGEGRPELPEAVPAARAAARVKARDVVRAVGSAWEVDARALEAGVEGQVISCEHLASRLRFRARVAGDGRVDAVEEKR